MYRRRLWGRCVLLVFIGLGLACTQIWVRLQVVAIGYTLSRTRQLIQTLKGERQTLEVEWGALTAPPHLAAQATQRLGLSAPQPEQVVRLP